MKNTFDNLCVGKKFVSFLVGNKRIPFKERNSEKKEKERKRKKKKEKETSISLLSLSSVSLKCLRKFFFLYFGVCSISKSLHSEVSVSSF